MPIPFAILAFAALSATSSQDPGAAAPGFSIDPLPTPASSPSRLPNLWTDSSARLGLSWVQEEQESGSGTRAALHLSLLDENGWSPPVEAASGTRWFVNWADFPSVASLDPQHLLAHFLEKTGERPYDYHVQLVRSADGGKSWSKPMRLHEDSGPGEHGFVSLVPLSSEVAAAVWLDGRNMGRHGESHDDPQGEPHAEPTDRGAMSLYARTIGADGELGPESLLDPRVCDCCPTAAVRAPDGTLVVAYRDRSPDEVRDISVVRWKDGRALDPTWSSRDGWKIAGCPVNGPALDATAGRVVIAWFTFGSDVRSRVLCAFSNDQGQTFSPPLELAGERAHGRVDAVFDAGGRFVVSWLESDGNRAEWRVARVDPEAGTFTRHTVVDTAGGRESGLGRLARDRQGVVFAWTETGGEPRVALRRLTWR